MLTTKNNGAKAINRASLPSWTVYVSSSKHEGSDWIHKVPPCCCPEKSIDCSETKRGCRDGWKSNTETAFDLFNARFNSSMPLGSDNVSVSCTLSVAAELRIHNGYLNLASKHLPKLVDSAPRVARNALYGPFESL